MKICVVGTGLSAYAFVRRIIDKNNAIEIKILEASAQKSINSNELLKKINRKKKYTLNPTHSIAYGGTSNLWHNVLAPLDEEDFKDRPYLMEGLEWPIKINDLEKHYKNVCDTEFNFDYELFNKDFLSMKNTGGININEPFEVKTFVHVKKYLRTKDKFNELRKNNKINIEFNSIVKKILIGDGKVKGLIVNKEGIEHLEKADIFILCAGGLNSAIPVMANHEICEELPCVGHYIMDHPMAVLEQYKYLKSLKSPIFTDFKFRKDSAFGIKVAAKIKPSYQKSFKLTNNAMFIRPSFFTGIYKQQEILKKNILTMRDSLLRKKIPVKLIMEIVSSVNIMKQIALFKLNIYEKHNLADIIYVTEQLPNYKNGFEYVSNELAYIDWDLDKRDLNLVKETMLLFRDMFIQNKFVHGNVDDISDIYDSLDTAAHHMGGLRMSEDKETGVVDKNLKMHGIDNLYVADTSVFRTSGNANPTLTSMALANRLAEHINDN